MLPGVGFQVPDGRILAEAGGKVLIQQSLLIKGLKVRQGWVPGQIYFIFLNRQFVSCSGSTAVAALA